MSGREVPSRCAIFSCYNYKKKGDRKSFYRFPRNIEICKQWVMRIGRVDLEQKFRTDGPESLHRRYTLCSDHFIEKDFRNKNILRHGIFPGSVPSVLVDTKENNSMPSLKREKEVGQDESVPDIQMLEVPGHFQKPHEIFISEQAMLEVPGHFQKPHEIFISEQADWSSENSAQEETDPLCLKEELIDGSAVVALESTQHVPLPTPAPQNAPVSESAASIATAEEEASMPKGGAGDTGPGSAVRRCGATAASPAQKAGGGAEEATDPRVLCPSHERKKVSHSHMITLAIVDSPEWQLPWREICRYIARNFPWVRSRASWRHSISVTMYKSPLFVKTRDANTHRTWTVVAAYAGMLRRSAGPSCCRWERVSWLRVRRPYSPRPAGVDRNSAPPTETADGIRSPLSSAVGSCRVGIPPPNGRREQECGSVPQPVAEVSHYVPPLQPIIESAFLQYPHSHMPLSEIYAYCIGHCPYYRSRTMQCYRLIKHILKREECFQRVAPAGSGPESWLFDGRSGDLPAKQSAASRVRGPSHPGRDPSRRRRLTKQASQPGSDSDDGRRLRSALRSYAASSCGNRATPSSAASQSGFGPERPRVSWLQPVSLHRHHKSHGDYPLPDKAVEVSDELDIKEEPFPEDPPTENICIEENGDRRQSVCATLLDGDCSGTVRMKQEKEEYPDTAEHAVGDTS